MKNRGKSVKTEQEKTKSKFFSDSNNFSSSSLNIICKKHPSNPSSVGICAYCLTEKLIKLVCSDCGEQRISSCLCSGSGLSSYRNSSCTVDVGSIGRISFLIENEKGSDGNDQKTLFSHLQLKQSETEDSVLFKRSNSCVVEVKKNYGFWRIGKLFKKKREKECSSERKRVELDQKSDVSRSRSLNSFMGDKYHNECSSAKNSDFNESEPRKSGLMGFESGFRVKETDFSGTDDDNDDDKFIDLEIDFCDKSKIEHSVFKKYDQVELIGGGGGIKKVKNNPMQAWKWIYKHHSGSNDHNHTIRS